MAVDYGAAWEDLAAYVAERPHHGSRDLALEMTRLMAVHAFQEDALPRTFRVYGVLLSEDLRAAAREDFVHKEDSRLDGPGGLPARSAGGAPPLRSTEVHDGNQHGSSNSRAA